MYNEYRVAIKEWKDLIKNEPNNSGAYIMLGNIYKDIGEYDNALENYEFALKLNPENKKIYYYMAQAKKEKGDVSSFEIVQLIRKSGMLDD